MLATRLHAEGNEEAEKKVIEIMNDEADHKAILEEMLSGKSVKKVKRLRHVGDTVEIETRKQSERIDALVHGAEELKAMTRALADAMTAVRKREPDNREILGVV